MKAELEYSPGNAMNTNQNQVAADDVVTLMAEIGKRAREAASALSITDTAAKNAALAVMARHLKTDMPAILEANHIDVEAAKARKLSDAFVDRLTLDETRIASICDGLRAIAELADPVGTVIAEWDRPNGLHIERVRTPLGVIGVIFESRPNVAADAGALCLKAGNAVILRGGSDSFHSVGAIHLSLKAGLAEAGLPLDAIQIVPTTDRVAVGEMLKGLDGNIDVIIPRGGRSLVERVQNEARVPIFAHLEGLCHLYVDKSADLEKAIAVAVNSKMRRTGICGALEKLLVDQSEADRFLPQLVKALSDAGCELRGSDAARAIVPELTPATEEDWSTEYLAPILTVGLVDGVDGAIAHIRHWSSNHTESIIAEDLKAVEKFFGEIDSAILLHNASTQFADGGEFGMGAEIGIATGKMHARGPVGVEQLTSFKYLVRGTGQIRP